MAVVEPSYTNQQKLERMFSSIGTYELELHFPYPISGSRIIGALRAIFPEEDFEKNNPTSKFRAWLGDGVSIPSLIGTESHYETYNLVVVAQGDDPFIDPNREYASVTVKSVCGGPGQVFWGIDPWDDQRERAVRQVATKLDNKLAEA